ncbi:MAG: DUF3596 domain-containing protein [Nostoc indistinguendum CM1-VF10]|jgi:integrase|nr:DUF3596 domain-containing protein [Nostoc indistinguendum CM1-VF10]
MATEVGIENKAEKLRLRLPRAIAVGSSSYISTGLGATPENLKKAQVVAWQIEEDIKTGQLDPTLERYKQQFRPKTVVVTQKQTPDLLKLWFGSSLLLSIRPTNPSSDSLVFTSPTGLPVHNSEFTNKVWKGRKDGQKVYRGIVTTLVDEGKVQRYRCLYNTRHTFISQCIEAGVPIPQIASWVGNSPEIIMRHYAGCVSSLEVPHLL